MKIDPEPANLAVAHLLMALRLADKAGATVPAAHIDMALHALRQDLEKVAPEAVRCLDNDVDFSFLEHQAMKSLEYELGNNPGKLIA